MRWCANACSCCVASLALIGATLPLATPATAAGARGPSCTGLARWPLMLPSGESACSGPCLRAGGSSKTVSAHMSEVAVSRRGLAGPRRSGVGGEASGEWLRSMPASATCPVQNVQLQQYTYGISAFARRGTQADGSISEKGHMNRSSTGVCACSSMSLCFYRPGT